MPKEEDIKTICCQCGILIKGSPEAPLISHGYCQLCFVKTLQQFKSSPPVDKNPSPMRDRQFRQQAVIWFEELKQLVKDRPDLGSYIISERFGSPKGSITFTLSNDLKVILESFEDEYLGSGECGVLKGQAYIKLRGALRAPFDLTSTFYWLSALSDLKAAFIHEAQHFQDDLRTQRRGLATYAQRIESGRQAYFRSAEEWNAYYQEGWGCYEDWAIRVLTKPELDHKQLLSWQFLRDHFSTWWHSPWVNSMLNSRRMKVKFLRRARLDYQFWIDNYLSLVTNE